VVEIAATGEESWIQLAGVSHQIQDACFRALMDNGEIERIARIERRGIDGQLYVRTALGRTYPAERIIKILKGSTS